MIIGCCGAGKSTLARRLHEITNLPLYHLDQYYWKENWTETRKNEWEPIVEELANKDEWIIDGNYGGTFKPRMDRADTIIYLNYNTLQCLYRVTKRIVKFHGKVRPDMPDGCNERFDFEFLHYVATYNLIRGKSIKIKLDSLRTKKRIIVLKTDIEVSKFFNTLT
jgi:adenylate kinase family enzyme